MPAVFCLPQSSLGDCSAQTRGNSPYPGEEPCRGMVLLNLFELAPSSSGHPNSGKEKGHSTTASPDLERDEEALSLECCYEAVEELSQGVPCGRSSKLHSMLRERVNEITFTRIKKVVRYTLLPCCRDLEEAAEALRALLGTLHKPHLYTEILSSLEGKKRALIEAYRKGDMKELQTLISSTGSDLFVITDSGACENVLHKCIYDNNIVFLSLLCSTDTYSDAHQINQRNRSGESALHLAARLLRQQAIRMLATLKAADFSAVNSKKQNCLHIFLDSAVKAHRRHGHGISSENSHGISSVNSHGISSENSTERGLSIGFMFSQRGRASHREYNLNTNCGDLKAVTVTMMVLLERAGTASLLQQDMHGFDCMDYALSSRSVALFAPVLAALAALDSDRAQVQATGVDWLRYLRSAVIMNDSYFVSGIAKHMLAAGGCEAAQYAQLLTLSVSGCTLTSLASLLMVPEITASANCRGVDGCLPIEAALRCDDARGELQLLAEAALLCLLRHGAKVHYKGVLFAPPPLPPLAMQLAGIDSLFTLSAACGQAGLLRILLAHSFDDAEASLEPLPGDEGYYLGNCLYYSNPLAVAVARGDKEMAELLLLSTPFRKLIDLVDPRCGLRPLHLALRGGSAALVSLLVQHGANLGLIAVPRSAGTDGVDIDIDSVYQALVARGRGEVGGEWEVYARAATEFLGGIAKKHFYEIPHQMTKKEQSEGVGRFLQLFYKLVRLIDLKNRLQHDNFSKWSLIYLKPYALYTVLLAFLNDVHICNHRGESAVLGSRYHLSGIVELLDALTTSTSAGEEAWRVAAAVGDATAAIVLSLGFYCSTIQRCLLDSSVSVWTQLKELSLSDRGEGLFWSHAVRDRQWALLDRLVPLVAGRHDALLEDSLTALLEEGGEEEGGHHAAACLGLLQKAVSCGAMLYRNDRLLSQCVRQRSAAPLLLLLAYGYYNVYSPQMWTEARALLPQGGNSPVREVIDAYTEYLSLSSSGSGSGTERDEQTSADPRMLLLRAMLRGGSSATVAMAIEALALVEGVRPAAKGHEVQCEVLSLAAKKQADEADRRDRETAIASGADNEAALHFSADTGDTAESPPSAHDECAVDVPLSVEAEREASYRLAIERVRRGVRDQERLLSGARARVTYGKGNVKYI